MICVTKIPQTQHLFKISEEKRDLTESIQLQETFAVPSNSTILSRMGAWEISLWQQGGGSATRNAILYKDSYFCVIWVIVVAVLVSIHCLTSTDVRKCRKIGPAAWVQEYSGKVEVPH